MKILLNNIIKTIFTISILMISQSKAQTVTAKDNNILSLSIECPTNPQCVYSGQDTFPIITKIINNSNQNLEIPLDAIKYFLTTAYFKNKKTNEIIGNYVPPGFAIPKLLRKLTPLPAHSEIVMKANATKQYFRQLFNKENTTQITLYKSMTIYIHYQGSEEPIGFYKDGKFEPKSFILQTERVITKK